MKLHMNSLHWSYSAPAVIDEEWQIIPVFDMLSISDSFESYAFDPNFMFDF